jgi:hypothetical protein
MNKSHAILNSTASQLFETPGPLTAVSHLILTKLKRFAGGVQLRVPSK